MTDLTPDSPLPEPPGDEADLLASLYLDGEATSAERAQVEADPALLRLVEEFRATASQLGDVSAPAGLATAQISAALDVFDAQTLETASAPVAAATPPPAANVASLADRRAKRSAGMPSWLGAAAVTALVVGGLGFAATRGSNTDDEAATDAAAPAASASNDTNAAGAEMMEDSAESADFGDGEQLTETTIVAEGVESDSDDAAGADEAMEESDTAEDEGAAAPEDRSLFTPDQAKVFYDNNGPFNLADIEAETASEYYEQLSDQPVRPIDDSPCAESPLVAGLFGVDSFIPVVFGGEPASLIVQAGSPSTALIVGPTCEIEQS